MAPAHSAPLPQRSDCELSAEMSTQMDLLALDPVVSHYFPDFGSMGDCRLTVEAPLNRLHRASKVNGQNMPTLLEQLGASATNWV